jgi:hypothetical protein
MKLSAGVAALALALSACGSSSKNSSSSASKATSTTAMNMSMSSLAQVKTASDLRSDLDVLLGEHIILASKATGAALAGNNDEFNAYGTELNKNGTDIGSLINAAFGSDAQTQFNSIWSAHDGYFVDYTKAVAAKDTAGEQAAVTNLTTKYVPQFSQFIANATGLPLATVTGLVSDHVTQTKAIVDDQATKNYTKEYTDISTAYSHMQMMGDPIAAAIASKMSSKFPGNPSSKEADLRVELDQALVAHLYLATSATDAALAGRNEEFTAAGNALNTNGTDIGTAVGGIFGSSAETQFNSIWSAHNGFFVDYTKATGAKDTAGQQRAVTELTGTYVPQFTDFIVGATGLPKDTVTSLITDHVTGTKAVVDDQAAKNWTKAAQDDVAAGEHMQMIGDPLASAIATKFPTQFPNS